MGVGWTSSTPGGSGSGGGGGGGGGVSLRGVLFCFFH